MWEGYIDQDQDTGYGICKPCQDTAAEKNEQEWLKLEKLMSDSLNPKNQRAFLEMDLELRRGLCIQAMEDGIITWKMERRL